MGSVGDSRSSARSSSGRTLERPVGIVICTQLDRVGRLGNAMFEVASTIGIARAHNLDPMFPPTWSYRPFFSLPDEMFGDEPGIPSMEFAPHLGDNAVYLQDYNLFKDSIDEIRELFRPSDLAKETLVRYTEFNDLPRPILSVHVRRGDNAFDPAVPDKWRYHPLRPLSYYKEAVALLKPGCASVACFGDDAAWDRQNIPCDYLQGPFPRSKEHEPTYWTEQVLDWVDLFLMAQCQPEGTMVSTKDGELPIEKLVIGDKVLSYCMRPSGRAIIGRVSLPEPICSIIGCGRKVDARSLCSRHYQRLDPIERSTYPILECGIKGYGSGRSVTNTNRKHYSGDLVALKTSVCLSAYTPDHPCIVRIGNAFRGKSLVYLMKRGPQFRVGVVDCSVGRKRDDIRTRMSQEGADQGWVLATFDSRAEAALEERLVSARYGVPEVRFRSDEHSPKNYYVVPEEFWSKFGRNIESGIKCLEAYGRDVRFPLFKLDKTTFSPEREILMQACNILDGMKVLDAETYMEQGGVGDVPEAWLPVRVVRESYEGFVYSLTVAHNRTYIADGIATHNCDKFVLSNSTYGLWAALLSGSDDVIVPSPWFGPALSHVRADLMFPSAWRVLSHGLEMA